MAEPNPGAGAVESVGEQERKRQALDAIQAHFKRRVAESLDTLFPRGEEPMAPRAFDESFRKFKEIFAMEVLEYGCACSSIAPSDDMVFVDNNQRIRGVLYFSLERLAKADPSLSPAAREIMIAGCKYKQAMKYQRVDADITENHQLSEWLSLQGIAEKYIPSDIKFTSNDASADRATITKESEGKLEDLVARINTIESSFTMLPGRPGADEGLMGAMERHLPSLVRSDQWQRPEVYIENALNNRPTISRELFGSEGAFSTTKLVERFGIDEDLLSDAVYVRDLQELAGDYGELMPDDLSHYEFRFQEREN